MTKIKLLDKLTIQKIAAGEVIENPASIVKELIENSIDAGAQNIIIEIKNGGKSYIRVTDDGEGMSKTDLNIAFERHSTSKLRDIEDIYNILSLGFRGEALSSISTVAKVEVLTKIQKSSVGIHALVEDGKISSIDNIGCPKGTTMIVKDLFYNLPVRQKFLETDRIETNKINNIINRLALGNKQISFQFIKDNKTILQTHKTNNLLDTIYTILGKEFSDNLIPINYNDNYINVKGFISNNKLYRGNRSHQYLYINNRSVWNHAISKSIEDGYKSLIPLNRFPIFIINLNLSPAELDINMHPTKQEVKFIDKDRVIRSIIEIIDQNLFLSINIPNFKFLNEEKKKELPKLFELDIDKNLHTDSKDFIIKDFTTTNFDFTNKNKLNKESYDSYNLKSIKDINNKNTSNENEKFIIDKTQDRNSTNNNLISRNIVEQKIEDDLLDIKPIGSIFGTYILAESKFDEKLFIVDQHAAHERVMYEKYKKEYKVEEIVTQQLISPNIIELTNSEMSKFQDHIILFEKLGFCLEEFGPNSVAVRGVPVIFGTPISMNLFTDILDNLSSDIDITNSYDLKLDKIMKIACTNSIKSGDKINEIEIMALFKNLQECENPFTCPHGRPTIIEMTKKDIEKEFLRIN